MATIFRHRFVGSGIYAFLMGLALAMMILSFFTPVIQGEAVQQSRELVADNEYFSKFEMFWRRGEFTDQFGTEVWSESPYLSRSNEDATFFRRCDGPRTNMRTSYILAIAGSATAGVAILISLIGMVFPRYRCRWLPFLLSLVFGLITVGLYTVPSIIMLNIWSNDRWCFQEFAFRDVPEFENNNNNNNGNWYNNGNFNPNGIPNNDRWNRYLFFSRGFQVMQESSTAAATTAAPTTTATVPATTLSPSDEIRMNPFFRRLAPQMQALYLNLPTEELRWMFRQDVATGRLGSVTVRKFSQGHAFRLCIASWVMAMLAFVVAFVWFIIACACGRCCGEKDREPFGRRSRFDA